MIYNAVCIMRNSRDPFVFTRYTRVPCARRAPLHRLEKRLENPPPPHTHTAHRGARWASTTWGGALSSRAPSACWTSGGDRGMGVAVAVRRRGARQPRGFLTVLCW